VLALICPPSACCSVPGAGRPNRAPTFWLFCHGATVRPARTSASRFFGRVTLVTQVMLCGCRPWSTTMRTFRLESRGAIDGLHLPRAWAPVGGRTKVKAPRARVVGIAIGARGNRACKRRKATRRYASRTTPLVNLRYNVTAQNAKRRSRFCRNPLHHWSTTDATGVSPETNGVKS